MPFEQNVDIRSIYLELSLNLHANTVVTMETVKYIWTYYIMKLWPSHGWFSNMMSLKHDYAHYYQFITNFVIVCKKPVSLPNLKSFRPIKQSYGLKNLRIVYYVIWENGLVGKR